MKLEHTCTLLNSEYPEFFFPCLHLYDIHQVYNMPGGCTKFSWVWLDQVDGNGHTLRPWCTTDSSSLYNGYCTLCKKPVSCENMGLLQLKQLAKSSKHKAIAEATFSKKQAVFKKATAQIVPGWNVGMELHSSLKQSGAGSVAVLSSSLADQTTTAEVIWALKVASSDFSFASCKDIPLIYQKIFPCVASNEFSMSPAKVAYLFSDSLGPYFVEELVHDLIKSNNAYTVH